MSHATFTKRSVAVVLMFIVLVLVACQTAAPVEVTREVEVEVTRELTVEVEVTREVEPTREVEVEVTREVEAEVSDTLAPVRTVDEKMANAMSAAPEPIAVDATILDYPAEWPGNWPDEIAPDLIEMRAGSNGWTCIVDRPDTPGNDPMCLNDVYLEVLMSQYNLVDAPSSGVGFGYMLQGGGPSGSPPHMMVFVPESNASFDTYGTEPGPFPWIMFPETSRQHLMVLVTPPEDAVAVGEDKIANAMSAGPVPIAGDATLLDYPAEWPGNWPDEIAPDLIEMRAGSNGWTCIVDRPDTPGNDPMCLNDVYLEVLMSQYNLVDAPSSGVGFGYMLQGGGPVGSPPHMMVFAPESNASFDTYGTEPGPFPWIMFPETSQQHLMVLTD
jgi:hypothetical protein